MAEKTNRTQIINLRTTPGEKALIQEKAGGARMVSSYLRKLALADAGQPAGLPEADHAAQAHQAEPGPEHDRRVKAAARRMPRRTAERVVSREEAKERAQAALKS